MSGGSIITTRTVKQITEERAALARQLAVLSIELEEAITARRARILADIDDKKLSRQQIADAHDVSLAYVGNLVWSSGRAKRNPAVPMKMWTDQQRFDFRKLVNNGYPRDRARVEVLGAEAGQ